jgi:LAO/AO transport system kinase
MVDFFLLIQLAGTGDELQGIKRGIMEMADGIVINKADGDNVEKAKMAQSQLRNALHLFPLPESEWSPEVLTYSGYYALGIDEVWDMIHRYIEFVKESGYFDVRRNKQSKFWMYETINERLRNDFYQNAEIEKLMPLLDWIDITPRTKIDDKRLNNGALCSSPFTPYCEKRFAHRRPLQTSRAASRSARVAHR